MAMLCRFLSLLTMSDRVLMSDQTGHTVTSFCSCLAVSILSVDYSTRLVRVTVALAILYVYAFVCHCHSPVSQFQMTAMTRLYAHCISYSKLRHLYHMYYFPLYHSRLPYKCKNALLHCARVNFDYVLYV